MRRADYDQALEAARRWIAEHGRYPRKTKAYRLELLCTLRRAREELGRWPTAGEMGDVDQLACLPAQLRSSVHQLAERLSYCSAAEAMRLALVVQAEDSPQT